MKISPLLLASLLAIQTSAQTPEPADLFERHFEFAGGRERLNSAQALTVSGTIEAVGEFTLITKPPGLLLLTTIPRYSKPIQQARGSDGRCWIQDEQGIRDLDHAAAGELVSLGIAFCPVSLVALGERLEDGVCEPDVAEGRPVYAIGRKRVQRRFPRLLFDSESGQLIRIAHTRLFEYRNVDGVSFPFVIRQGAKEVFRVKQVRFSPEIATSMFERPGPKGGWLGQFSGKPGPSLGRVTKISPPGRIEIVTRPVPAAANQWKLSKVPMVEPGSGRHGQFSIQGADLRALDLTTSEKELTHADFDTRTLWPSRLPASFEPRRVLELGKDPGLGVRELHKKGITGKGVGIAIIDFPLLTEHQEYAARLKCYEEIESPAGGVAHMHGTAVASIAAGKTCGVAPEADLYAFASVNHRATGGKLEMDFEPIAATINRVLDINTGLSSERKIRVISLSMGWTPGERGYVEVMAATERAKRENVFVLSTALRRTHSLLFDGLNRPALSDPNQADSYGPGSWWASIFWSGEMRFKPGKRLCVPMDGRTTASPKGASDYTHYDYAGWSWSVPWLAGLYALACQVCPETTPETFWREALRTGRTIELQHEGETIPLGTIADPQALVEALGARS